MPIQYPNPQRNVPMSLTLTATTPEDFPRWRFTPKWNTLQNAVREAIGDPKATLVRIYRTDRGCDYRGPGEFEVDFRLRDGSVMKTVLDYRPMTAPTSGRLIVERILRNLGSIIPTPLHFLYLVTAAFELGDEDVERLACACLIGRQLDELIPYTITILNDRGYFRPNPEEEPDT